MDVTGPETWDMKQGLVEECMGIHGVGSVSKWGTHNFADFKETERLCKQGGLVRGNASMCRDFTELHLRPRLWFFSVLFQTRTIVRVVTVVLISHGDMHHEPCIFDLQIAPGWGGENGWRNNLGPQHTAVFLSNGFARKRKVVTLPSTLSFALFFNI